MTNLLLLKNLKARNSFSVRPIAKVPPSSVQADLAESILALELCLLKANPNISTELEGAPGHLFGPLATLPSDHDEKRKESKLGWISD